MLAINDLSLSIQKVPILNKVALSIEEGQTVGLIGRNGAGKTTLMLAVMGLIERESGELDFKGVELHQEKAHARALLGIGYLPEDRRLVPHFMVEENILVPLWALKGKRDLSREHWWLVQTYYC